MNGNNDPELNIKNRHTPVSSKYRLILEIFIILLSSLTLIDFRFYNFPQTIANKGYMQLILKFNDVDWSPDFLTIAQEQNIK